MMKLFLLPLLFVSSVAFAQSSPMTPAPAPSKPALIRTAPAPSIPVMDDKVLRLGLIQACSTVVETQAFNSASYKRGKDLVPDEAELFRREVNDYIKFACPCTVDALDKDVGLSSATPEKLVLIRQKFGTALQQTCSKDVYIASRAKQG